MIWGHKDQESQLVDTMLMIEAQKWVECKIADSLKSRKEREIHLHQEMLEDQVVPNSGMSWWVKARQKNESATILINSKKLRPTTTERFPTEDPMWSKCQLLSPHQGVKEEVVVKLANT
jgi:hypothetical protein